MSRYLRYVKETGRGTSDERATGHLGGTPLERALRRPARWAVAHRVAVLVGEAARWPPRLRRRSPPPSGDHTDRYPIDPEYVLRVLEPQR